LPVFGRGFLPEALPETAFRLARQGKGFFRRHDGIERDGGRRPVFGEPSEDEIDLDLGQSSGRYRIIAIPVFTVAEERGPNSEASVILVIRPVSVRPPKRRRKDTGPSPGLFGDDF